MGEFFKDNSGKFSMVRLGMFINLLVAAYVSIIVVVGGDIGYDAITLIFGLWVLAYGGKNAAKYIENIKPVK